MEISVVLDQGGQETIAEVLAELIAGAMQDEQ